MKNREIERKFIVDEKNLPDLSKSGYMDINQGYIHGLGNQYVFRLRQVIYISKDGTVLSSEYFQTIKGSGFKEREEYEATIWNNTFSVFWPLCKNKSVHKFRYEIPIENGDRSAFLDIYKNELKGLFVVEVEFGSIKECDSFIPLPWFGEEVTQNPDYTNVNLALNGLSKK
jgi:CYTH domain-containing protein